MYVYIYIYIQIHTLTQKLQSDIQHDVTSVTLVICSGFTVPDASFCGLSYFSFFSRSSLFQEHLIFSYRSSHYGWHHTLIFQVPSQISSLWRLCAWFLSTFLYHMWSFSHLKHNRFLLVTLEITVCHCNKLFRVFCFFSLRGPGLYLDVFWETLITVCKFAMCSIELSVSINNFF